MTFYIAYLFVFLFAATPFFEVVGVIPIGVAAGLDALPVAILSFLGNMMTILLVILLMDKIKAWLQRRKEKKEGKSQKREERAARIWKRFGLPGLSLISPILVGSHLGAILAMGFGGTKNQITIWMTASILIWSVVMGVVSHYGIDFLFDQTGRGGFLVNFLENKQ